MDDSGYEISERIELISRRLNITGLSIFFLTVTNIFVMIVHILGVLSLNRIDAALIAASIFLLAAFAVGFYDFERRRGVAMVEVLSESIQTRARNDDFDPRFGPNAARKTIRSFSATTDLPLIPGQYGPFAYVLVNVIVILAIATKSPLPF